MTEDEMNNLDEGRLRDELREFPVAYQRPAAHIRIRGRQIRRRHRAAVVTAVVVVLGAIATPSLAIFQKDQPQPAEQPRELECVDSYRDRFWRATAVDEDEPWTPTSLDRPAEVPAELRLLWPASAAASPHAAEATDSRDMAERSHQLYRHCSELPDESMSLVWVEDETVSRALTIQRVVKPAAGTGEDTLTVGSTEVMIFDHANGKRATWTRGGHSWLMTGGPINEDEIAALVRAVRYAGGEVAVSDWSLGEGPTYESHGSSEDAAEVAGVVSYEVVGDDVGLSVDTSPESLWSLAYPGAHVSSVGDSPALVVSDDEWITWQPASGVTARLYNHAEMPLDELLVIAEQVRPAPADDSRFVESWKP